MEPRCQYRPEVTLELQAKVNAISFSPEGHLFAAGIGRLLRIWDFSRRHPHVAYIDFYAHEEAVVSTLTWTESGLYCAYTTGELAILSFDQDVDNVPRCHCHGFQASSSPIHLLAIQPSRRFLAAADTNGVAILKGIETTDLQWEAFGTLPQPRGTSFNQAARATCLAWMPNSNDKLLVAYEQHGIVVWDILTKEPIEVLVAGPIPYGLLSLDARYFAVATDFGAVDLYDTEKKIYVHCFSDFASQKQYPSRGNPVIRPVVYMHRGRCLLAGGDGRLKMWRLDTKNDLVTILLDHSLSETPIQLVTAHTSPSASSNFFRIAAAFKDNFITVWAADVQGFQQPLSLAPPSRTAYLAEDIRWQMILVICPVVILVALSYWLKF